MLTLTKPILLFIPFCLEGVMKKYITFKAFQQWSIATIVIIAGAFATAQADEDAVIKGSAKGIPDQQISLRTWMLGNTTELWLTAQVVDGAFEFKGKVDNPPAMLRLEFENPDFTCADAIIWDNSNMSLSLSLTGASAQRGSVAIDSVKGSASHDTYVQFNNDLEQKFNARIGVIFDIFRKMDIQKPREEWGPGVAEKIDPLQAEVDQLVNKKHNYLKQLAGSHSDQLVGLLAMYQLIFGRGPEVYENDEERATLFAGLNESLRTSQFGVAYNAYATEQAIRNAERKRLAAEVAVGKPFKDFTQNDVDGNPVKASDLLKPGRYVFLDFWASWCGPCRAENPNVLKAYKKYHNKGFDVLAVSLDRDKEDWLEAIEEDGMPWIHVSDLKGWDNAVSTMYGVRGIPMNFLLNEKGTIVASDLRERALHDKLEELLGSK